DCIESKKFFSFVKDDERDAHILVTWKPLEYLIEYDLNGGSFLENASPIASYFTSDESYALEIPVRTGYNFSCWQDKSKYKMLNIAPNTVGNLLLKALWKPILYELSFFLDDENYQIKSYTIEDNVKFSIPFKKGYSFEGWCELDGKESPLFVSELDKGSIGDRIYYAKWKPVVYKIEYNCAGGALVDEVSSIKDYVISEDSYALPLAERNGYKFAGWCESATKNQLVTEILPGTSRNLRFIAQWIPEQYSVSFFDKDGTKLFNDETYTIEKNISLPVPEKKGWVFSGWNENINSIGECFSSLKAGSFGNKTLYAHYKPEDHKIFMHLYEDGKKENVKTILYNSEMQTFSLETPVRNGWQFDGWYADAERTRKVSDIITKGSTGDKNFYALWKCTVTFDSLGGRDCGSRIISSTASIIGNLPETQRDCYTFDGWYSDKNFKHRLYETSRITKDTTAYARWVPVPYSIVYKTNGGELPDSYVSEYTVETPQTALPVPKKKGFGFAGWYADPVFKTPVEVAARLHAAETRKLFERTLKRKKGAVTISATDKIAADIVKNKKQPLDSALSTLDIIYESQEALPADITPSNDLTLYAKWFRFDCKVVPAGRYIRSAEALQIENIPYDLEVSTTEISRDTYEIVMGIDPSDNAKSTYSTEEEKSMNPVQNVSWFDALVFCNKLSILHGFTPAYKIKGSTNPDDWGPVPINNDEEWVAVEWNRNSDGYRLPTEQEWMWCAMGGPVVKRDLNKDGVNVVGYAKKFAGHNTYDEKAHKEIKNFVWYMSNSKAKTHISGLTKPNEVGLEDMSGNVWEWCWDAFEFRDDDGLNEKEKESINTGVYYRSIRGGSWYSFASLCSVSARLSLNIYGRNSLTGFRVVRMIKKF
ncbi:MAG: SUMF1/EgtB/PvdO family nonheme iron enzyme, partial [Treponema sp.]|nr:SUMF1/EgtB/PvdO family nonheme iron enzyme [Treponema sp.]